MAKKYVCVTKVSNDKFVKYHVNNLKSYVQFITKNFKGWRWTNVYKSDTKQQYLSFTNRNAYLIQRDGFI